MCGFQLLAASANGAAGEGPRYLGLKTTLAVDLPHVLGAGDTSGVEVRVDGSPAEVEAGPASSRVRYTDSVGRDVTLDVCVDADGFGSGRIERCTASGCDRGRVTTRPLTLNPAVSSAGAGGATAAATDYELVAEYQGAEWPPGPTIDLTANERFALLARGADGLRVIGLDSDGSPELEELAHAAPENQDFWNDVKLFGDSYALVASRKNGLLVLDLDDPRSPRIAGTNLTLANRANGHNIFVRGAVAYLARSAPAGGLTLIDLGDPTSPQVLADIELPGCNDVHDLYVTATEAYVNCYDFGLLVVDLGDPRAPAVLAQKEQAYSHSSWVTEAGTQNVVLFSAEDFATTIDVATFDVTRGLAPLASFSFGSAASMHNLECAAARCFVSAYQEGWFELDISDPSAPIARRGAATWNGPATRFLEGASGIAVLRNRVLVADTELGLLVYQAG